MLDIHDTFRQVFKPANTIIFQPLNLVREHFYTLLAKKYKKFLHLAEKYTGKSFKRAKHGNLVKTS